MMEPAFLMILLSLQILDVANGIGITKFAFNVQRVLLLIITKSVLL